MKSEEKCAKECLKRKWCDMFFRSSEAYVCAIASSGCTKDGNKSWKGYKIHSKFF